MSNTAGVIYDSAALDRIKGWTMQQSDLFEKEEKKQSEKEWLAIIGISVVAAGILIFVALKTKK
jgi:hypothetical protein